MMPTWSIKSPAVSFAILVIVWLGLDNRHKITDDVWNGFLKGIGESLVKSGS